MVDPVRFARVGRLVKEIDPETVVAYYCENCGTVYKKEEDAKRCSVEKYCSWWLCVLCGKEARPFQGYCNECQNKKYNELQIKKMENVKNVIPWKEYPDDQGVVFEQQYHGSIDDFLDYCHEHKMEVPSRVYATKLQYFKFDPDSIKDAHYEMFHDCENEAGDIVDEEKLVKAIEEFNQVQTACLYFEDEDTVVSLEGIENE